MVAYLDTSVLLQHILAGDEAIKHVFVCDVVVSSELLSIECSRVLHRYRLQNMLDDDGFLDATLLLRKILASVSLMTLSSRIKSRASESFPLPLKTLGAIHMASAMTYQDEKRDESFLLFSYDNGLNRCAKAMDFTVPFYTGL